MVITVIRDAVNRLVSEWKHVQRGAHWGGPFVGCGGRRLLRDVSPCFAGGRNYNSYADKC